MWGLKTKIISRQVKAMRSRSVFIIPMMVGNSTHEDPAEGSVMDVESLMGNMEGALKPVKVLTKQKRVAEIVIGFIAKRVGKDDPN